MKKLVCILLICTLPMLSKAQVFTGSAKDKSSIIYQGTTLGLSITDPSINFSLNNFSNEKFRNKNKKFVWAANATAASNSGIANFFDGGSISSGINANAFVGYTWVKGQSNKLIHLKNKAQANYSALMKTYTNNTNKIESFLNEKADLMHEIADANISAYLPKLKDADKKKRLSDAFNGFVNSFSVSHIDADINALLTQFPDDSAFVKATAVKISAVGLGAFADSKEMSRETDKLFTQIMELRGYWQRRYTIYLSGGYSTNGFKWFDKFDTTNFAKSFQDKIFRGYNGRIGVNVHFGSRWLVGGNVGYEVIDNFKALSSKDYTITTTQSNASGQQIKSEKKITAYSGEYFDQLKTYPLNADVILFIPVNDSAVAALNLYLRQTFSDDKKKLPETTNIGLGVYFFNNIASKFLGGIYVEAPDMNNNIAKNDPEVDLKPLNKRLTFGLVAKFTFSSIFSYQE